MNAVCCTLYPIFGSLHYRYKSLHFFTGIIESDDIKAITDEIDKAVVFSNQASSLVDSVKVKYKIKPSPSAKVNDDYCLLEFMK